MKTNQSCNYIEEYFAVMGLTIPNGTCNNVINRVFDFGVDNAMMYMISLIQNIKIQWDNNEHTESLIN